MSHLGVTIYDEISHADKITKGIEFALEGKVKDNTSMLINNLLPMLIGVSQKMDPQKQYRIAADSLSKKESLLNDNCFEEEENDFIETFEEINERL